MSAFYKVSDITEILDVSEYKVYKIIQQLNKELKEKGFITIATRVPVEYFKEKYYCLISINKNIRKVQYKDS